MNKYLIIILLCCISLFTSAQNADCTHYAQYMQEGDNAQKKGDYDKATNAYLNAMIDCVEKKDSVRKKLFELFEILKNNPQAAQNTKQTILDLREKGLTEIPPSVFEQTELKILLLGKNTIQRIPKEISVLKHLMYLDLSFNQISKIENLDSLKSLYHLDFWGNEIEKLEGLDNLVFLENLMIGGNNIHRLEGLGKLKNLQRLMLWHNQIEKIEGLNNLNNLVYFDISENNILKPYKQKVL